MLDALTQEVVMGYEDYLRDRGLTPNTTSFYMRILRAVYNRAVERGGIEQKSPFRKVYTGVDHTRKRALPLVDIRRISRLSLASTPHLEYARDIFMLSFYMRGMSLTTAAIFKISIPCSDTQVRTAPISSSLIISDTPQHLLALLGVGAMTARTPSFFNSLYSRMALS